MAATTSTYDDLPPGSLISQDGQVQWAGLLMGPGTSYRVDASGLTGWEDLPEIDSTDADKPTSHGAWPGARYARSRLVGGQIWTLPTPDSGDPGDVHGAALDAMRLLRQGLTLSDDERWLAIRLHGETLAVRARVSQRVMPVDQGYATQGVAKTTVQWLAADPRRYLPDQMTAGAAAPQPEGGLTWSPTGNLIWPLSFGEAASTGDVPAYNDGSAPTQPVITFTGPCTTPAVIERTSGRMLRYDLTLAPEDQLVVDTSAGTVTLNGTASRRAFATMDSDPEELFAFGPGQAQLSFRPDISQPGATMTATWRSAEW